MNAPADALEKSSVRENSSLASELAALVRRCPWLERLSVPASAAPGSEAEAVEEWSDVLASSCAGTLKRLCFQRPITPTGLLLLVAGAQAQALEAVFVAALCVAAPGAARVGARRPPPLSRRRRRTRWRTTSRASSRCAPSSRR